MNHSVAVLPTGISFDSPEDATRFLKLPHPRTGAPALFLPAVKVMEAGNVQVLLEVQAVNASGDKQRSWFTGDDKVIGDGKMLLLTPFDPIFLLVRILLVVGQSHKQDNKTRVSLPYDDIFESASSLLRFPSTSTAVPDTPRSRSKRQRQEEDHETNMDTTAEDEASAALLAEDMRRFGDLDCTRKAMRCICAEQNITPDLSTYRLDEELLQQVLQSKVDKLASKQAFETSATLTRILAKEGITESEGDSAELHTEARRRAALDLIAGYLPKDASSMLRAAYKFPRYDEYLTRFGLNGNSSSNLSTPALSATSSSVSLSSVYTDAISTYGMPKRRSAEEREAAEKKKKKKAPTESMGVRQLKKVSTKGMTPLTSFFAKKTPTPSPNSETPPEN